jgi:phage shock protein C
MNERLYRSESDKMIAGVCAGLAERYGIDPVLVRLAFALLALHGGLGLLAYVILWIVMPTKSKLVTA